MLIMNIIQLWYYEPETIKIILTCKDGSALYNPKHFQSQNNILNVLS